MDILSAEEFIAAVLQPDGQLAKSNYLINIKNISGRRDSLTELQQKILTAAISLVLKSEAQSLETVYTMAISDFLNIFDDKIESYVFLVSELEKISGKGVWLYDKNKAGVIRTQWFQAIECREQEIKFTFTDKILQLIRTLDESIVERQLIKGIQYRGKHTLAVFDIIRSAKPETVAEYSISELMQRLSLEYTRYSYGQLKLRVLEPSLKEIYEWDNAIFVNFGPTFNGRRVEGIWFEVTTGPKAKKMREKEPDFKFALPEQKPIK